MNFETFTGQVQHRLELAGQGEAVRASRAILTTLGECLDPETARELAAHLPMEIDRFPVAGEAGQDRSYREFVTRIGEYEHEDAPDASYDAQVFVAYLADVVPADVLQRVRDDLPSGFDKLFAVADREGTTG
jgi:uncharacterized protein (DUF2267 family)